VTWRQLSHLTQLASLSIHANLFGMGPAEPVLPNFTCLTRLRLRGYKDDDSHPVQNAASAALCCPPSLRRLELVQADLLCILHWQETQQLPDEMIATEDLLAASWRQLEALTLSGVYEDFTSIQDWALSCSMGQYICGVSFSSLLLFKVARLVFSASFAANLVPPPRSLPCALQC
jgi:hypothetical protein